MPQAKTSIFEMDRRQLLKLTGTMGIGATFIAPTELLAKGLCEEIALDNDDLETFPAGATLQFWIDGLHFASSNTVKSRANITLFMALNQSSVSYVESVVLMDPSNRTLGARYFDASMKLTSGHVPYVRFENVEISDPTKPYRCVYTVRSGSKTRLYTALINDKKSGHVEISRLNREWLPPKMEADFRTFLKGNTANPTPGLITTQYQYYTQNGLTNHCARGRILDIGTDGSFRMNVDFMHGDSGADHFMRYFIAMDPVGRILGFHKRDYDDPRKNSEDNLVYTTNDSTVRPGSGSRPNVDIVNISADTRLCWNADPQLRVKDVDVSRPTDDTVLASNDGRRQTSRNKIDFYAIPKLQLADIRDCPYIQFYTEDSYDAVARNMIRLR